MIVIDWDQAPMRLEDWERLRTWARRFREESECEHGPLADEPMGQDQATPAEGAPDGNAR
jgi:hypothetical protein